MEAPVPTDAFELAFLVDGAVVAEGAFLAPGTVPFAVFKFFVAELFVAALPGRGVGDAVGAEVGALGVDPGATGVEAGVPGSGAV